MFMNYNSNQSFPTAQVTTQQNADKGVYSTVVGRFNQAPVADPSDTPRHACRVCGKCFRASSLLDIHMRVHVGAKPFVCTVCNHRATQKGNLKLHMKKHHGLDLPSHIDMIPDSGIWGNSEMSLEKPHSVPSDEGRDFPQFQAGRRKTALAHSSLLDPEIVELIKKCQNNIGQSNMGRITENLKDFVEMAKRNGITPAKIKKFENSCMSWDNANCNNNGKDFILQKNSSGGFSFPAHLINGLKEKCDQMKNEQRQAEAKLCCCSICGWKTTSPGYLNVHMRKHKAESHICTICGRAFKETWYLKNHMRSHINDLTCRPMLTPHELIPNKVASLKLESSVDEHLEGDLLYNMCNTCGQMFHNDHIEIHIHSCGIPKKNCTKYAADGKEAFMQLVALVETTSKDEKQNVAKPEVKFNPTIGCINIATKTIENNVDGKITKQEFLPTPPPLDSMLVNSFSNDQAKVSSSHPQVILQANEEINLSANNLKPYRNPAMVSLASIGKSLNGHKYFTPPMPLPNENAADMGSPQNGYKCNFCPKWFKYRSVLGIHMRSHTGERPYKCQFCGYAGTQHNCLKLHLQRHHPKEYHALQEPGSNPSQHHISYARTQLDIKQENDILAGAAKFSPARCPICGRVSPSPGYLKIHMRSHKKTLDHVCNICGRGFKEYWYLSTHLRTHDREGFNSVSMEATTNPIYPQPSNQRNENDINPAVQMMIKNHIQRPKIEESHSSWSPLDQHEDVPFQRSKTPEPKPVHVSRRKSSQPSRHTSERYEEEEQPAAPPTRSRKSKPRKLSRPSYMAPVFQVLSPELAENGQEITDNQNCEMEFTSEGNVFEEQPLDLSVANSFSRSSTTVSDLCITEMDEPLNLAIK